MTGHEFHEEEALGKAYDSRLMGRLLTYLRPHRGVVAISTVLLIATALLELAGPLLTKIAIDRHISGGDVDGLVRISVGIEHYEDLEADVLEALAGVQPT